MSSGLLVGILAVVLGLVVSRLISWYLRRRKIKRESGVKFHLLHTYLQLIYEPIAYAAAREVEKLAGTDTIRREVRRWHAAWDTLIYLKAESLVEVVEAVERIHRGLETRFRARFIVDWASGQAQIEPLKTT